MHRYMLVTLKTQSEPCANALRNKTVLADTVCIPPWNVCLEAVLVQKEPFTLYCNIICLSQENKLLLQESKTFLQKGFSDGLSHSTPSEIAASTKMDVMLIAKCQLSRLF